MGSEDILAAIIARKRLENARRRRHLAFDDARDLRPLHSPRAAAAEQALRRPSGEPARIIAEIKLRSPSAGVIRARVPGDVAAIAAGYGSAGAAAVSVLCDGPGFGGSVLDVRRAAAVAKVPVLFKEFVLDPVQLAVARDMGASLVLLLVRALAEPELRTLVDMTLQLGLSPVVEAADIAELEVALRTGARIVGVNARDLRTFRVDPEAARRVLAQVPGDRIAVFMSGIRSAEDLAAVAAGRADAALVGEGLMRAASPPDRLAALLAG